MEEADGNDSEPDTPNAQEHNGEQNNDVIQNSLPTAEESILNGICPYFTMFPLTFPYAVLKEHAATGQLVLDPFCGRGTTNFACRLLGLSNLGIDSSPIAVASAEAKLVQVTPEAVVGAAARLLRDVPEPNVIPQGDFWTLAYHPTVLRDLCRLRQGLLSGRTSDTRKALLGILLGALHGPLHKDGTSAYFSNQCPRTFAPKPNYAVKFWREKGYTAPLVDVLELIEERANRYYGKSVGEVTGRIARADSRDRATHRSLVGRRRVDWVITSPPYYGMRTYIPDQWLRNWFLGGPSHVDYSSGTQIQHGSPESFAAQLQQVWLNAGSVANTGARMVIRFGGIHNRKADPLGIVRSSLEGTRWRLDEVRSAGHAEQGKRQADHFLRRETDTKRGAKEEHDLWATWLPS